MTEWAMDILQRSAEYKAYLKRCDLVGALHFDKIYMDGVFFILTGDGIGREGVDMFTGQIPDEPNECIVLFDEQGVTDPVDNAYGRDGVGLQVITRGSYDYAKGKIWDIHSRLVGKELQVTPDGILVQVMIQGAPTQIDNDEKGRRMFTAHYISPIEHFNAGNRITI
jgi:hypothetical protein